MDEKLEKKLKKLLSKAGIDEAKIDEVVADLQEEGDDEVVESESVDEVVESEGETPNEESVDSVVEDAPVENTETEEQPAEAEGEVVETIEPEVVETAPVEEQPTPLQPEVDFASLESRLEESEKANEGLLARISALEEALKKSGVLEEEVESVGIDESKAPSNDDSSYTIDSTLSKLNRGSF